MTKVSVKMRLLFFREIFFTGLVAVTAGTACAADFSGSAAGTASGKFLSLGSDARAAAMGEAYSAAPLGADAVRYNPAALLRVSANSAQLMRSNYLANTSIEQAAFARRLDFRQAAGISILQMNYGKIAETDETGYRTGSAHPSNLAIFGAYACRPKNLGEILDGTALGVSIGYIRSKIVSSAKTFTASLGILSPPYGNYGMQIALTAENLAGSLKFDKDSDPLPMSFKLGGIAHLDGGWTLAMDIIAPKDNAPYAAAGAEKWLKGWSEESALAARAGYNISRARELQFLSGLSAGIGISYRNLLLDYALAPFGDLGYAHKLTLTFNFGESSAAAMPGRNREPALGGAEGPEPEQEPEFAASSPEAGPESPVESAKTFQDRLEAADDYIARKDYFGAAAEYDGALKELGADDKRRVYVFEQRAQISLKLGDIAGAKDFYLAAIAAAKKLGVSGSSAVNSYMGLAWCLEKSGNTPAAVKNYEKALELVADEATEIRIQKALRRLKTMR